MHLIITLYHFIHSDTQHMLNVEDDIMYHLSNNCTQVHI